jgi:uncharacterized repeat protein (TIGR01451 family)
LPDEPISTTRREKVIRATIAILAALMATVLTVVANVASQQVNNALDRPQSTPTAESCLTKDRGDRRVGEQFVDIYVTEVNTKCFRRSMDSVKPGDEFRVRIEFENNTAKQVDNVTVQAWLPDGFDLVPGTTSTINSTNETKPDHQAEGDGIIDPGYNFGSYSVHGNFYVYFNARMSPELLVDCGMETWAIGARLPDAPAPDDEWVTAGIISVKSC